MEAVSSTLKHSYTLGQQCPNKGLGAKQSHGSPPEPGRPEEQQQQHHKPFFYVQSSQPCFPMQTLQWPLPYNPYYTYPGLGFGLPVMPHYQINPYMEPPGFIVPHTQLHLMDYRRMLSPQYYQTMAFHARRFRCQPASAFRETTSSEVQTEPLQRTPAQTGPSDAKPRSSERSDCPAVLQHAASKCSLVTQTEESGGRSTPPRPPLGREQQTSPPHGKRPRLPAEKPDILLVGTSGEGATGSEELQTSAAENLNSKEAEETPGSATPNFHLPFEPKYLDELKKMESIVWSAGDTSVSSLEPLVQNGSESMAVLEESLRPAGEEMLPEADLCFVMEDLASEDSQKSATAPAETALFSALLLESSPLQKVPPRGELDLQDHQDTSFESLPAYLPSSSWLSDFENIYYSSKLLPASRKQSRPLSGRGFGRRRKVDLEFKEPPKQKFKLQEKADRRSLSDHECCLSRKFTENVFSPHLSKAERLCSRCLSKRRICSSSSPTRDGVRGLKRKAAPFQQWNDVLLPTCDACSSHAKIRLRKASDPDLHSTEGESDGNSSCPARMKWRSAGVKRPLASKQNVCAAAHPKLRERCACAELLHPPLKAWERLHSRNHGNNIPETDENCFASETLQCTPRGGDSPCQGWQAERSWRDAVPATDRHRSQHANKHKMSQPPGNHTKDTRC
ncbi:uncharacterized protein LOC112151034 isoform X2 [Oryzias melastigma]|uniref:uncharacterized protein LOC112151034 isoform X2 n=1 Tax=Oryzias melastigma TaxID=30732 RepID=UPI000CF7E727|nr:uncharacterized protein LOC112151034 isoform X2 [Oryzias melastigma]